MTRYRLAAMFVALGCLAQMLPSAASAQAYPAKPVRLIKQAGMPLQ